jgi:hypothetical protein
MSASRSRVGLDRPCSQSETTARLTSLASAGQEWQFGVSPEEMLSLVGRLCQSIRELHEHATKVTQGLGYLHDVADQLYVLGLPPNSVYERERHASEDRPAWDKLMAKIEAEEPPEKIVEFRTALALKSIADSIWSLEEFLAGRAAIDPRIDHLLEMLQALKPGKGDKK